MNGWTLQSVESIDADGSCMTGFGDFNGSGRAWVVCGIPTPGTATAILSLPLAALARRRRVLPMVS